MDHIDNRRKIERALREELFGPSPQGQEIDCSGDVIFAKAEDSYGPWRQKGTGEEILQRDVPTKRFGVGVLYPVDTPAPDPELQRAVPTEEERAAEEPRDSQALDQRAAENLEEIERRAEVGAELDPDDFDLSGANSYRPSSLGVSFLADFPDGSVLVVEATGGRYRQRSILVAGRERVWWLRSPVTFRAEYGGGDCCSGPSKKVRATASSSTNDENLDVKLEVYSRPVGSDSRRRLVTVCLVNRARLATGHSLDEICLFQTALVARVISGDSEANILPYPAPPGALPDPEEQSLALLYRNTPTYATGHGCAANWEARPGEMAAASVTAECLPSFEAPSVTPDVTREDGSVVEVPMKALAGFDPDDDGFSALAEVVDLYETWIGRQRTRANSLGDAYRTAARRHLDECERCAKRMRTGLEFLTGNPLARHAFVLANRAVLLQQLQSRRQARGARFDEGQSRIVFSEPSVEADPRNVQGRRGKWRAFQIAFLLMSARSVADGGDQDRKLAELIWFPTGGGKTEAYLGLAAYSLFLRRLKDPSDSGVEVLMRYTLRLLTAQQFQRASALICAMEKLRRENERELGAHEFSIGIWVGGDTTPNTRAQAKEALKKLRRDHTAPNPFLLDRCPWCGAYMGPLKQKAKAPKWFPRVLGYEERGESVGFSCPDASCRFSGKLPVYTIDDDIYESPPSLIIGTVDKFAMLAWRSDSRSIFGIDPDGRRVNSPPGLIIQDELHLISGPLGSMVGLYESAIEDLCTDRRGKLSIPPKIVSSTATIRRFSKQIEALYARPAALFPPPGLEAGDSFFARYARNEDGSLKPGRMYIGVHGPGLGSVQTAQARTFSSLLQAPLALPGKERDPWWSLLVFFNSLRELGTTLSLFQSDIPDYLKVIRFRTGAKPADMRRPWNVRELTGRLRDHEVPQAIAELEIPCGTDGGHAVDVCLASNIIEVGVDIDRLSLMSVLGQPKTTSQYIQVTGRVGRSWWERPGLVVTIYSPSKPRDRSHFEKFRSYHEQLYAQVEPASVTPFSPPALDRALHAVMALHVRQSGPEGPADSPYPYPQKLVDTIHEILLDRVSAVDGDEVTNFEKVFAKRAKEWRNWERLRWTSWDGSSSSDDSPQLREAGSYASSDWAKISWPTPMSMRNVDAECQAEITQLYLNWDESDA